MTEQIKSIRFVGFRSRKPIKVPPAWAVVDVDGTVLWGLVFTNKREASRCAKHPKRRVVRLFAKEVRK